MICLTLTLLVFRPFSSRYLSKARLMISDLLRPEFFAAASKAFKRESSIFSDITLSFIHQYSLGPVAYNHGKFLVDMYEWFKRNTYKQIIL